jgi:hypothetical protein
MSDSDSGGEPPETVGEDTAVGAARKALALVDQLVKIVSAIQTKLTGLARDRKHDRKIIIGLVVSICLDVSLSVVTIFLAVGLNSAQNSVTQTNLAQCTANNSARVDDALLWNTFLNDAAPPGKKLPPAQAKEVAHLRSVVSSKDAQRDCTRIFG